MSTNSRDPKQWKKKYERNEKKKKKKAILECRMCFRDIFKLLPLHELPNDKSIHLEYHSFGLFSLLFFYSFSKRPTLISSVNNQWIVSFLRLCSSSSLPLAAAPAAKYGVACAIPIISEMHTRVFCSVHLKWIITI